MSQIRCPYCGKKIPENSIYCSKCGRSLNFTTNSQYKSHQSNSGGWSGWSNDQYSATPFNEYQYNNKRRNNKPFLTIGILLLAILTIFVIYKMSFSSNNDSKLSRIDNVDYNGNKSHNNTSNVIDSTIVERLVQERLEQEKAEQAEQAEAAMAEQEGLEQEKAAQERLEQEKAKQQSYVGTYEITEERRGNVRTIVLTVNDDETATMRYKDSEFIFYGSWYKYDHMKYAQFKFVPVDAPNLILPATEIMPKSLIPNLYFGSCNTRKLSDFVLMDGYLYSSRAAAEAKNPDERLKYKKVS